jgi:hypothetical protein
VLFLRIPYDMYHIGIYCPLLDSVTGLHDPQH